MQKNTRLTKSLVALTCSLLLLVPALAQEARQIDVPAGDLVAALESLSNQLKVNLVYQAGEMKGLKTDGVKGSLTPREAVAKLLEGTSLLLKTDETTGAMMISRPPDPATKTSSVSGRNTWSRFRAEAEAQGEPATAEIDQSADGAGRSATIEREQSAEVVVVTGSRIRGARPSSPVVAITQEEMRRSGHHDLGEAIRALPQNFSGGQNPGVASGASAGGLANQNVTGSSSFNLRGLGPDATLTLLNGTRLPYDGFVQATDVSVIPVAAIDRIEVLLDGASAIYGSDAVGGVANIILKRDFQGVELSARYGVATEGGNEQTQYTAVAGHTWDSGGFLITGDLSRNTAIRVSQREYLSYMPRQNIEIYPENRQSGGVFSGHQDVGALAEITLDAFYTDRRQSNLAQASASIFSENRRNSTIWGGSPGIRFELSRDWSLRVHGTFGRNEAETDQPQFSVATGAQTSRPRVKRFNEAEAVGVEAEGALFGLPGGEVRLAAGGGYRRNEFRFEDLTTGATVTGGADRSRYGYTEVNLPILSKDQGIFLVRQLSLIGAMRHEDYSSFGATTTPKVGLAWGVVPALELKASWGKSFKVPTLTQQFETSSLFLLPGALFPGAPAGRTLMQVQGGDPALEPERARVVTAGFVANPNFLPGFTLEFGWFDIDYEDRVVIPITPFNQALISSFFADFVTLNPSIEQQNAAFAALGLPVGTFTTNISGGAYNPATVHAIVNNRHANAASQSASGFDLAARYATDVIGGRLTINGNASTIDGERNLTRLSPEQDTTGVVYFPADFRGRLGASWSKRGLTLASAVNHIDGIRNTSITPNPKGGSMTTVDLVIDYRRQVPIGEVGFNLAVENLLDRSPPFLQPSQLFLVNYDSTNYSAVGRTISAALTARF